jgi:hypothetical protein
VQKLAGAEIRERPPDSGAREDDMMEVVNFKRIAMAGWSLGMGPLSSSSLSEVGWKLQPNNTPTTAMGIFYVCGRSSWS